MVVEYGIISMYYSRLSLPVLTYTATRNQAMWLSDNALPYVAQLILLSVAIPY